MTQMIAIKRDALLQIVQQAMFLGQIQYMTMIKPERDRIKQREAQRYLENLGYSPKLLDDWRNMGLIHRRKDGGKNSPVYYSLKEIQKQISVTEMTKGDISYLEPK